MVKRTTVQNMIGEDAFKSQLTNKDKKILQNDRKLSSMISDQGYVDKHDLAALRRRLSYHYVCCNMFGCCKRSDMPVGYFDLRNMSQYVVEFIVVEESKLELVQVKKRGGVRVGVDNVGMNASAEKVFERNSSSNNEQSFTLPPFNQQDKMASPPHKLVHTNTESVYVTLKLKVNNDWVNAYVNRKLQNMSTLIATDGHNPATSSSLSIITTSYYELLYY